MGQGSAQAVEPPPTEQVVNQNIELLFGQLHSTQNIELINTPIIVISRNFSEEGSFRQTQQGFRCNPCLLKCTYHPHFETTIHNMLTLITNQLKNMLQSKMMVLVSRQRFRKASNIANFLIYLTNESLIQTINLLSVRSDLDPSTKQLISLYNKDCPQLNHLIIDSMEKDKLQDIAKTLRVSINMMIDLHLKLLTRSDFTLQIIDRLSQSAFVLYSKIFFSAQNDIRKRQGVQNAKNLLKIGSYFLGLGIQNKIASIFQLSVILLEHVLENHRSQLKNQKSLPSHLFKTLPIVSHNEIMHWLANTLFFSLKYVKHDNAMFSKLNINRIHSFKLLNLIFQHFKPHDHQLTYLLEEICLQTKPFQLQRVYVSAIAQLYAQTESTTPLIRKYSELTNINFNIKGNNKEIKIKPEDVRTQLEDDQDTIRKEMLELCNKYTVQVVFQKPNSVYEYNDKALWNMILYQLEEDGSELIKQKKEELNKEGEVEQP